LGYPVKAKIADIFFSHFNVLLSLIDEVDFIKGFITDGDKQINFQLITFTFLMFCRARKIYTALQSERPVRVARGLMVSGLVSGSSGLGSSPGRGHCVVFLGKTYYSHSASLYPGV